MSEPKLRFFFREPTVDTNRPLNEGTIKVDGFDFEVVGKLDEADAWDCGFAARMLAAAEQSDDVSIPAFPNRKFRLSYIYVNDKAGIRTKILEEVLQADLLSMRNVYRDLVGHLERAGNHLQHRRGDLRGHGDHRVRGERVRAR